MARWRGSTAAAGTWSGGPSGEAGWPTSARRRAALRGAGSSGREANAAGGGAERPRARAPMGFTGLAQARAGRGGWGAGGRRGARGVATGGVSADVAAALGGGWRRGQRQVAEEERAGAEMEGEEG
nr:circumsporozoite protein-like [Aegilops tauschii subsp. strangulata]